MIETCATLRLDNVAGKQSMRIGIKVNNASAASDCGITITTASGKAEVSVLNGQNKIYKKDTENDSITYTAVITGIDTTHFDTEFTFSGSVTSIDGNTVTSSTSKRSVNSVVENIGSGIKLSESGVLVKELAALNITDTSIAVKTNSDADCFKLTSESTVKTDYFETSCLSVKNDGWGQGVAFYTNPSYNGKHLLISAEVTSYDKTPLCFYHYISATKDERVEKTAAKTTSPYWGDWTTLELESTPASDYTNYTLHTNGYDNPILIKSFTINEILTKDNIGELPMVAPEGSGTKLDLTKIHWATDSSVTTNSDGSLTATGTDFGIKIPSTLDLSKGAKLKVTINGQYTGTNEAFRVWLSDDNGSQRRSVVNKITTDLNKENAAWVYTYTIGDTSDGGNGGTFAGNPYIYFTGASYGAVPEKLTITSIVVQNVE